MAGLLSSLLPTLIVLGALIFIHELGHYIACRLVGVTVEKFSIGFGPELFHFQFQGTRVSLSLIPFGGFVKPKGESSEDIQGEPEPDTYLAKGTGPKILIVSAGVIMNYVLAFVLFAVVAFHGRPVLLPVVGALVPGYPAEAAGVLPGDRVLSVDGSTVSDWMTLTLRIASHGAGPLVLNVEREGRPLVVTVEPREEVVEAGKRTEQKLKRIGIKPSSQFRVEKFALFPAIGEGARSVVDFTVLTYRVIWGLITGEVSFRNIAGPVGIVAITGETAKQGMMSLLLLTALLSVNLAVINLLPIPALDGGHLFFLLIEAVRRKPINQKLQERMTQVGFFLLMGLMVFIVFNDIQNFAIIEKIKRLFGR